jgi:hypothetical protein
MGFTLDIKFIDHFNTPLVTTLNYNATANIHDSQITTAPDNTFPACCIFISRSLATASNSEGSSASRAQVLSLQTPVNNRLGRSNFLPYNSSALTTYKHPVSKSTRIVGRPSHLVVAA